MGIAVSPFKLGHEGVNQYGKTWETGANSVGGIGVMYNWKNTGTKTIKYVDFTFVPYNAVGDAVGCTTRNVSEFHSKETGPITPGQLMTNRYCDCMWYNHTITSVKLIRAEIQYTDGTEETIEGSNIEHLQGAEATAGSGCYVATAVYGSYDCPQVWTLRRYRDYTLAETRRGRAFIKTYYAISPTLVRWFGNTRWFKAMWRGRLDKMVQSLQAEGVESTPYNDRIW